MSDNLELATLSEHELSIDELTEQVNKIQKIMESVMIVDTHYGTIPGTSKPTLYKAGAEKLNLVFRLSPTYEMEKIEHDEGHREYNFVCRLTHLPSGLMFAEGYGSCSTLESKYRYRWDDTDIEVPKEYWKTRDISLLGGSAFTARKTWINKKQVWHIFQKVEISDPADYYNTCLKIGKKRALIDATLTATAASDIFIQDLDDNPNIPSDEYVHDYPNSKKNAKPDVDMPESKKKTKTEKKNEPDMMDVVMGLEEMKDIKVIQEGLLSQIDKFLDTEKRDIIVGDALLKTCKKLPNKE